VNLWVVFLLCGLWHGAKWTFVFWGAYYGLWLTLERLFLGRMLEKIPPYLANAYAFLVILIGWVFFRSSDLPYAFAFLGKMFDFGSFANVGTHLYDLGVDYGLYPKVLIFAIVAILASFLPETTIRRARIPEVYQPLVKGVTTVFLLSYSVVNLATGTFNPFLYFQF
jgi:alginate O-acetyltransferase complex protein AlgI